MKKQEPTIRLSNQKCAAHPCGKTGFILKSEHRDLSMPLCIEHMTVTLTEWEKEDKEAERIEEEAKKRERERRNEQKQKGANGSPPQRTTA